MKINYPVNNVTGIFSCIFDGRLVWFENETKSDGNPIIFWANAMEIPWFEHTQNPCHVSAWNTNKTWINDMVWSWHFVSIWIKITAICDEKWRGIVMEFGVNLDQTATKSSCDGKGHCISMRIHVIFFTGCTFNEEIFSCAQHE